MQQVDISPPTNVYATFGRLNYTPWHAIAEFVDNATQSYFSARKASLLTSLRVRLKYSKAEDYLVVEDNAMGMTGDELARALLLSTPPEDRSGRSEFGMGMKTAACWFGSMWSVTTSKLGEPWQYKVVFDVDKISSGEHTVSIERDYAEPEKHGTTLRIERLARPIAGRQIEKTKRLLASIYRLDIRRGDVVISWNDTRLRFDTPVLMEREVNGVRGPARAEIDIEVKDPFTGQFHQVTGWVGVLQKMSQSDAGFALLRRGRMVVGGPDANWRPTEVVGSSNSHSGKRLIGELYMDDFPVNFQKDGFVWDGGLEEELINVLAPAVADLRAFADNARLAPKKIEPEDFRRAIDEVQKGVATAAAQQRLPEIGSEAEPSTTVSPFVVPPTVNAPEHVGDVTTRRRRDVPQELVIPVGVDEMRARLVLVDGGPRERWLEVNQVGDFELEVLLNTGNTFVAHHIDDETERTLVAKFALAVATAEAQASLIYGDEVPPDELRRFLSLTLDHSVAS